IAKKSNLKILIVGNGALHNYLKLEIQNSKLNDRVILYGWAKDSAEVAKLINESRALIMLSYNEGGPRVILEALACGVPVIATPVGIVPDVLSLNNGRIVEWSSNQAIKAFDEIKSIKVATDLSRFDKAAAIKNYADNIKEVINA
ncbi:MAG: Glycosyl transferase, group 1, partial [Candidatus Moranbacteria bacterium GW2011_GWF2_35_39]